MNGLAVKCPEENIRKFACNIADRKYVTDLTKSKYVDDSKITDHYAIIPTGQGYENYNSLNELQKSIYNVIALRFLAVFYPPAVFNKISLTVQIGEEFFFASAKTCKDVGYLEVAKSNANSEETENALSNLKKGQKLKINNI